MVAFGLLPLYPSWSGNVWMLVATYALLAYPLWPRRWPLRWTACRRSTCMPHDRWEPAPGGHSGASLFRWCCRPCAGAWRLPPPLRWASLQRRFSFRAPEWATLTTLIYQRLGRQRANLDSALVLASLLMLLTLLAFAFIEHSDQPEPHHA